LGGPPSGVAIIPANIGTSHARSEGWREGDCASRTRAAKRAGLGACTGGCYAESPWPNGPPAGEWGHGQGIGQPPPWRAALGFGPSMAVVEDHCIPKRGIPSLSISRA